MLPRSTASSADEAAFWLRLIAVLPVVEIPLAARPWRGENERSGIDGFHGSIVRYEGGSYRNPHVVALAVDEEVARLVALLAELTDYAVLMKQLGKRRGERGFESADRAIKNGDAWDGDPDTKARWYRLAAWLRAVGDELPAIVGNEKRSKAAAKDAAAAAAKEREAHRDVRRWPRFAVGDRVLYNGQVATIESARRGGETIYDGKSAPEYSARTDRGVLLHLNDDSGLESAPVTPEYVLRLVDAGFAHSVPVAELLGRRREVADMLVLDGALRKMAARGRFPERFVVTTTGSHRLGTFASDDPNFREDAREAGRKARAARPAPRVAPTIETKGKHAGQLRMFNPNKAEPWRMVAGSFAGSRESWTYPTRAAAMSAAKWHLAHADQVAYVWHYETPSKFTRVSKGKMRWDWWEENQKKARDWSDNPGDAPPVGKLTTLGILTELGAGRRVLSWNLRDAPVLAYDAKGRLFIVYVGKVARPSSPAERKEYARTHWGARGRGDVRGGGRAVGPFKSLGAGTSIQYTTKKGGDRRLVNYVHEWGEGGPRAFTPPTIVEHDCKACGPRCGARGALALSGGTYRVTERGIVG